MMSRNKPEGHKDLIAHAGGCCRDLSSEDNDVDPHKGEGYDWVALRLVIDTDRDD